MENKYSALDVVEAVVTYLEDDPAFDAGRGELLNSIFQSTFIVASIRSPDSFPSPLIPQQWTFKVSVLG